MFRRGVTDPQIMVPQLRALIDLPEHVSLRVLPYSASWHAGTDGSLTILAFSAGLSPKPRTEGAGGAVYVESTQAAAHCEEIWEGLDSKAMPREDSQAWISDLLKEHSQ